VVDLTQPYVWSTTRQEWANSGCSGCEFHIPDASPETTALIERIDRELGNIPEFQAGLDKSRRAGETR
jgi:hypothetical protein